jgi:hypothetical protein
MLIDCDTCIARDHACGDCVMSVLLARAPEAVGPVDIDDTERAAIDSLAAAGLVPPLRLVSGFSANVRDIA